MIIVSNDIYNKIQSFVETKIDYAIRYNTSLHNIDLYCADTKQFYDLTIKIEYKKRFLRSDMITWSVTEITPITPDNFLDYKLKQRDDD